VPEYSVTVCSLRTLHDRLIKMQGITEQTSYCLAFFVFHEVTLMPAQDLVLIEVQNAYPVWFWVVFVQNYVSWLQLKIAPCPYLFFRHQILNISSLIRFLHLLKDVSVCPCETHHSDGCQGVAMTLQPGWVVARVLLRLPLCCYEVAIVFLVVARA